MAHEAAETAPAEPAETRTEHPAGAREPAAAPHDPGAAGETRPAPRPPAAAQPRALKGFVDVATVARIRGWVWRPSNPDERVRLELVEDGISLAVAVADKFRADLEIGGIGDGRHAFAFELSPGLLADGPHVLQLRCQATNAGFGAPFLIEQPASQPAVTAPAPPPSASHTEPRPPPLHATAPQAQGTDPEDEFAAATPDSAAIDPDLLETPTGAAPAELFASTDSFDEPEYVPMIARSSPPDEASLDAAPREAGSPILKGHVDGIQDDWTLAGWAYAPASGGPLTVELTERGFVVADIIANRHRQDLQAAGYGNGACGFRIRIPAALFDGAFHDLRLNAVVNGQRIPLGAPLGMVFPDNFKDRGGVLPAADIFQLVIKGAARTATMDEPRLKELAAVFQLLGKRFGHATSLRLMYTYVLRRPIDAHALVTRLTRINTDINQYFAVLEEIMFSAEARQTFQNDYSSLDPISYLQVWTQDEPRKPGAAP